MVLLMSESSETDPPESGVLMLPSVISRDLIGIVLSVVGAYGTLVLPGHFWVIPAVINGGSAILIFTSDATNSTNAAGYFVVLASWSLLAFGGLTTRVAIPTMLTGFWFGFEAERKIYAERLNS